MQIILKSLFINNYYRINQYKTKLFYYLFLSIIILNYTHNTNQLLIYFLSFSYGFYYLKSMKNRSFYIN